MRGNKLSIDGLIGVHVSSMVELVIMTISSQFLFFYKKGLSVQKRKLNQNQITKQNYAKTKQQRQHFSCA